MLRIHFTERDLTSVVLADDVSLMWELVLSVHRLQARRRHRAFDAWQAEVLAAGLPEQCRVLLHLAPPIGYTPDFLTPEDAVTSIDAGRDAIADTDRSIVGAQVAELDAERGLAAAQRPAVDIDALVKALDVYWHLALAPYWQRIRRRVHEDLEVRRQLLATSGIAALLESLGPGIEWQPPFLIIKGPRRSADLHLDGRGIVLQPAYFCLDDPTKLRDPLGRPTLVHPTAHDPEVLAAGEDTADPGVARLIGPARHEILGAAAVPGTTSDLADRAGVSVSAASRHAAVLRAAGLLASYRTGRSVEHRLTDLGRTLLDGA